MLLILLLISVSGTIFYSFDPGLDPADIHYPGGWSPNPIDLSTNHAGETATVIINCNIQANLVPGFYVSVQIPGFSANPFILTNLNPPPPGQDSQFVFQGVVLPSAAGTYGPISILVRSSSSGDIIASSQAYGSIGIVPPRTPVIPTLSVSYASSSESTTVNTTTSLSFFLPISLNLKKYDYFVLTLPNLFKFAFPTLVWGQYSLQYQMLGPFGVAYNSMSLSQLNSPPPQTITVYGLQQDLMGLPLNVSFTIGGLQNPSYVTTGTPYNWMLEFFRFGTHTGIQRYSGTGPTVLTTPGAILSVSWGPSNGYLSSSSFVSGLLIYMTLSFNPSHNIPAGGSVLITYSNANVQNQYLGTGSQSISNLGGTAYIYSEPIGAFSSCALTSSTLITCSVNTNTNINQGSPITIYTLTKFTGSNNAGIVSIVTKDSQSNTIDLSNSNLPSVTYLTSSTLLSEPTIFFSNSLNAQTAAQINLIGGSSGYGIVLNAQLGSTYSISTTQTLNLAGPFSSSSTAVDMALALGGALSGLISTTSTTSAINFSGNTNSFAAQIFKSSLGSQSSNSIQFTPGLALASSSYVNVLLKSGTGTALGQNYLPNFPSNLYTRYETCLYWTAGASNYVYCKPLTFTTNSAIPTLSVLCGTPGILGLTAQLSLTPPFIYTPASGYSLFVKFTIASTDANFPGDLGSGLQSGSIYPTAGLGTNSYATLVYTSAISSPNLLITLSGSLTTASISFTFPFASMTASCTYTPSATIYSQKNNMVQFSLSTGTGTAITATGTSVSTATITTSLSPPSVFTTISSYPFSITSPSAALTGIGLSIILPQGWTFTGTPSLTITTTSSGTVTTQPSSLTLYTSNDPGFLLTSAHLAAITTGSGSAPQNWVLTNITPLFSKSSSFSVYGSSSGEFSSATDCTIKSMVSLPTATAGKLTIYKAYSPATSKGLGADTQVLNLSITLTTPTLLKANPNNLIQVTMGTAFTVVGCTWTIAGPGNFFANGTIIYGSTFYANQGTSDFPPGNIVITVYNVPAPAITASGVAPYVGFSTVVVSYNGNNIFSFVQSSSSPATTTFSPGTAQAASNIISVYCYPNIKGSPTTHFSIKFSPTYPLPAGTSITFTGETFSNDASAYKNSWFSHGFNSVSVNSGNLILTTRRTINIGDIVELRKDQAFPIGSAVTVGAFWIITATYGGATILSDVSGTTKALTYSNTPTYLFLSQTLSLDIANQGEQTGYKFTIKLNTNTQIGWTVLFDVPNTFDAHFGPTNQLAGLPGVFYLTSSSSLGSTVCLADHWIINCTLNFATTSNIPFDITILGTNPATSSSGNFYIYVENSAGTIAAYQNPGLSVAFTNIPSSRIDLVRVNASNPFQYLQSDYIFSVNITENYQTGGIFAIGFPLQYSLPAYQSSFVPCSATNRSKNAENLLPGPSTCNIMNNLVVYNFTQNTSFYNDGVDFVFNGIFNPNNGTLRSNIMDMYFDATDFSEFPNYQYWTNKFVAYSMAVSFPGTNSFTSKSYMNLNAAYLGFYNNNVQSILINSGNPVTVIPGTFSDFFSITVPDQKLKAKSLTIVPIYQSNNISSTPNSPNSPSNSSSGTNGPVVFDSNNYILTPDHPLVNFKIGTAISVPIGFYSIRWTIAEVPNSNKLMYANSLLTQLQVIKTTVQIFASTPSNVPNYGKSLPVTVSIDPFTTFSDFTITLSLQQVIPSNPISFYPSTLIYKPKLKSASFSISNSGNLTVGTQYNINFNILGTDQNAYKLPSAISFTIGPSISNSVNISSLVLTHISPTQMYANLVTNASCIITWALVTETFLLKNRLFRDYNMVANLTYPLAGAALSVQTSLSDQVAAYNNKINLASQVNTDSVSYTKAIKKIVDSTFFTSQTFFNLGQNNLTYFDYLVAGTRYCMIVWADNYSGNIIRLQTNHSTSAPPQPAICTFGFNEVQPSSTLQILITVLAQLTGLNLNSFYAINSHSRRLGTTYTLGVSTSIVAGTDPSVTLASISSSTLGSSLISNGVNTTGVNYTSRTSTASDFPNNTYISQYFTTSTSTILFNFTPAYDGVIYCIEEYNPSSSSAPTSVNVQEGYSRDGTAAYNSSNYYVSSNVSSNISWNFINNTNYGRYYITCDLCNNLQPVPKCQNDTSLNTITFGWNGISSQSFILASSILVFLVFS